MPRRSNPMQQIEARQRVEDHVAKYSSIAADHGRATLKSKWETATDKKIAGRALTRALDKVQSQHDEILVARRKRLAEMLQAERAEHEEMLRGLGQSDDQRRERLFQKARDLRVEREQLRQEESSRQKDRLFRDQSALVRQAQSRIKVLHIADERRQQLEEAQRRKEDAAAEERFWAEQQQEGMRQRAVRSQNDLQAMHTLAQSTKADLARQVVQNKDRRDAEKAQIRAEEDSFVQATKERVAREAEADAAKKVRQRELAAETRVENEAHRAVLDAAVAKQKAEEKAELDALLKGIAADEERERQRRVLVREEAKTHRALVEAQMSAQAESETALDRLWQEENDRQWGRREAQWSKEQTQREATLKSVFDSRRLQVTEIRNQEVMSATARREEHGRLVQEARNMLDEDALAAGRRRQVAKDVQAFQRTQAGEKAALKDLELQEKQRDLGETRNMERLYEDRIQRELKQLDGARPAQYGHVKLTSTKRGISGLYQ